MNPISALIASTGLCASRAFLPAFLAACLLRFGADHQVLRDASANLVAAPPNWFTSDWCLFILGALAALELAAQRSHDARAVLAEVDRYAKPVMGAFTALGMLSATDAAFVERVAPQQAGIADWAVALAAGAGTHAVARARGAVLLALHDADSDDATGVHSVLAWAEDAYAALGMVLFLIFPVLMAVVIGLGIGAVWLLQRRARAREEAMRLPCHACATPMYRSALACPKCGGPNPSPCAINWLGSATTHPISPDDHADHAFRLRTKRRCHRCACRHADHTARAACPTCTTPAFPDAAALDIYDARLRSRILPTLGACALLGLVPVAGLVAGVLFYRVHLISPYRAYVPRGRGLLIRIGLRVVLFVLVAGQIVPGAGVVLLPVMAALNVAVYRGAFLAAGRGPAG